MCLHHGYDIKQEPLYLNVAHAPLHAKVHVQMEGKIVLCVTMHTGTPNFVMKKQQGKQNNNK